MKVWQFVRRVAAAAVPALALAVAGCATTGSSMKAEGSMASEKGMT